jgi:UDP-GlcNAc3NAcA epimerase
MKKILTVLGARPQFIKASVVSQVIANTPGLTEVLVHTGQHFDLNMSDVFFEELDMNEPEYFLDIHGGTHGAMTGRMLEAVEKVILNEKPDIVLVYGDTNSTLAGALSAAKLNVPVAHVEAGLRSNNLTMPEEVNRILTDRISTWLFTPTQAASKNLRREGYLKDKIIEVGDVMYDVALHHGSRVKPYGGLLARLGLTEKRYLLATIHRQENTDHPLRMKAIVEALIEVSKNLSVVWPLHPRTRIVLEKAGMLEVLSKNVLLIDPVGYLDMVQLEKFACLIATDSGGVQKEAFFYQVPCITLRDETEWVELIDAGWNKLAPPNDSHLIVSAIESSIGELGQKFYPYGDGRAAQKIVSSLIDSLIE